MVRRLPLVCCTTLVLLLASSALPAQVTFDITSVARSGDAAPVPSVLVRASSPSLNNAGAVAFAGDGGVFLQSDSGPILVAGYGDPAPGGGIFRAAGRLDPLSMNASGQIMFSAEVDPPGTNGVFLYSSSTGAVSKVIASGDPAPGGGRFSRPAFPALNDPGQVAFVAGFSGGTGIFLSTGGGFTQLVRSGDPAPGGGTFSGTFRFLSLNANGIVAFWGTAAGGQGLYTVSGSTVQKIARAGDPAPTGGQFSSFGAPSLNAAGQVAFAGTDNTGATGLYLFSQGQITLLAAVGDPAPGGGAFVSFSAPSLNAGGDVAFVGDLSPFPPCCFGESGVFLYSFGNLSNIVRPGDTSPEGDVFSSGLTPSLNDLGQVAFTGHLNGSVGGIYLSSETGIARIAGEGDPVMRDPKFFQALIAVINNAGQIVFGGGVFPGAGGLFDGALTDIARIGDQAPDGGEFANIAVPAALNDNGQVAFWGQRSAVRSGLFLSSAGVLSTIVSSGDAAPGGGSFRDFFNAFLAMNSAGDVVADGTVPPPGRSGLFRFSNTGVSAIVQLGDPAPGGGTFTEIGPGSMNNAGDVAFVAFVSPPGRSGIFLSSANMLQAIAQTGDAAPGGGSFQFLKNFEFDYTPSVNNVGQVAFGANLSSTGGEGVFLYSGGQLSSIARPGAIGPSLNDSGQVAFFGNTDPFTGTFLFSNGTISKVAATGDPAPGGGTLTLPGLASIILNNQGLVVFDSILSTGGFGVFLATPSTTPGFMLPSAVRDSSDNEVCPAILDTLVSRGAHPRRCR